MITFVSPLHVSLGSALGADVFYMRCGVEKVTAFGQMGGGDEGGPY